MRSWLGYAFTILLVSAVACGGWWLLQPLIENESFHLFAPVPVSFALPTNNQVATLDLWEVPKRIDDTQGKNIPDISAKSGLVFDFVSGKTLFAKNTQTRLPLASLTKIMTAIIALENPKQDDMYMVRQEDLVGEDSMGLTAGETLSLSELLYGMMLHSGNDAAEVFASNFPSGRDGFVAAMNEKVATLGLSDTHFSNPTGLQGDGEQYTTVKDLLVITRYALFHFATFRDVVSTFDYAIPATTTHKAFYLENETNLLTSYPGVKGVKTGYTPEAGLCLVTYLNYGGHQLVGVVLNSNDRRDDMKELLDFSLKQVGVIPPRHS